MINANLVNHTKVPGAEADGAVLGRVQSAEGYASVQGQGRPRRSTEREQSEPMIRKEAARADAQAAEAMEMRAS